ncbi:MAG: hypothetical protein LBD43_03170 [Holosporales bacterium]|nr:hypothetical protein [Holosporales bacterium]
MKQVASVISKIMSHCNGGHGLVAIHLTIAREWDRLIKSQLVGIAAFGGVRFVGQCANQSSTKFEVCCGSVAPAKLVVTVNVLSSAVLIVRSYSGSIVDGIKRLVGVPDVELIFKHVSSIPKKVKIHLDCQRSVLEDRVICEIDEVFENESLKRALELLKTEIQNAA